MNNYLFIYNQLKNMLCFSLCHFMDNVCLFYRQETHIAGTAQNNQGATPVGTNNSAMNNNSTMNNPANMLRYNQPHPTPHPQQPRLQMMNCPPPTRAAYMHQSPYQTQVKSC